jgi:methionyl-tRNA formyltransferase
MRIIFAGTPEFAAAALSALRQAGHDIPLVMTQPDRPAGRGLHLVQSAVKRLAVAQGLDVVQPASLTNPEIASRLRTVDAAVMIVAAYGLIIPPEVLTIPRHGCINIHASLLPRWRGAAPIQRALLAGDEQTGISIMQMDAGLDTGPVLLQEPIPVTEHDTAGSLHDRLAALGARLVTRALEQPLTPCPQDEARATYAKKINKSESRIDWSAPVSLIERQVRAFDPTPGASTSHHGLLLKVWRAVPSTLTGAPGTVLDVDADGITIACGSGALRLTELQRAGGKRVPVSAFVAGYPIRPGERLES